jgi:hypothetical protein
MTNQDILEEMDQYTFSNREDNIDYYSDISRKAPNWNRTYDLVVYNIGCLVSNGYTQKEIAQYFDVSESTIRSLFKRTGIQRLQDMFYFAFKNNQAYLKSRETLQIDDAPPTAYDAITTEFRNNGLIDYYADNILKARKYDVSKAAFLLSLYYDDIDNAWNFYLKVSGLEQCSYAQIFLNINNWPDRESVVKQTLENHLEEFSKVYKMLKQDYDRQGIIDYCENVLDGDDEFLLSFD